MSFGQPNINHLGRNFILRSVKYRKEVMQIDIILFEVQSKYSDKVQVEWNVQSGQTVSLKL